MESLLWVWDGRVLWAVTSPWSPGPPFAVENCILKPPSTTTLQHFLRKCPNFGSCEPYLQQIVAAIIILTAAECHRLVSAKAWGRALPLIAGAFLEKYKSYQVTTWIRL